MIKIFTFCFLFISCYSIAQPVNLEKVVITSHCWGRPKQVDTVPIGLICKPVDLTKGLTGKVSGLNVQRTDSGVFGSKRICCNGQRSLTGNNQPLLIVDGVPAKLSFLSEINPKEIENVEIFKSAAATAIFGPDGANGALWVITKAAKLRKFIIKDLLDDSPIAGATLSFVSADQKDKLMFLANDSGVVITDNLQRSAKYILTVSSVGHQTLIWYFENGYKTETKEILLAREIKTCGEVVVSTGHGFGCCLGCGFTTHVQKGSDTINIIAGPDKKVQTPVASFGFKVYPNPVQRGITLNLQFNNDDGIGKLIRIISLDGKPLLQETLPVNKGLTHFTIATDARWSAGIYFVQLLYENGRVAASEKVILQ